MREIELKKNLCLFKQTRMSRFTLSRAFDSCLACQHFISGWLGKLKRSKLSTGCHELNGVTHDVHFT